MYLAILELNMVLENGSDFNLNPKQRAPEIAWAPDRSDFLEKRDRLLSAKEKISRFLIQTPSELRLELAKLILGAESDVKLQKNGSEWRMLGFSSELQIFLTGFGVEEVIELRSLEDSVLYPAFMAADNFYLLSEADRKNLVDFFINKTSKSGKLSELAFLLLDVTTSTQKILGMGNSEGSINMILPEAITPFNFLLVNHIFKNEALIKKVCESGESELIALIAMGKVYGFFDDEVDSLDIRRVLTPYIYAHFHSDSVRFLKSFIKDLIVDPLYDLNSSRLRRLKQFALGPLRDITTIRKKEAQTGLSATQIGNLAAERVAAEYDHPNSPQFAQINGNSDDLKSRLIGDRQAALFSQQEKLQRENDSSLNLATALRRSSLSRYDNSLRESMGQFGTQDANRRKERDFPWLTDSYLKRVFTPSVIQKVERCIFRIFNTYKIIKESYPQKKPEAIFEIIFGENIEGYQKKDFVQPIYSQELLVNSRDQKIAPLTNFLQEQKNPAVFFVFLLGILEKAILARESDIVLNEAVLQEFKLIITAVLQSHYDTHSSFQPASPSSDLSEVDTPEGFSKIKSQSLVRMASIDLNSGIVGLNNFHLQKLFEDRIEFAREFNSQMRRVGVTIGEEDFWQKNKDAFFNCVPMVLFFASTILFFSETAKYDNATITDLISICPVLIPAFLSIILIKLKPSAMFREYYRPDFFQEGVEENARAWENQIEKLRQEREKTFEYVFRAFVLALLAVLIAGGFLASEVDDLEAESFLDLGGSLNDMMGSVFRLDTEDVLTEILPLNDSDGGSFAAGFGPDLSPKNRAEKSENKEGKVPRFRTRYGGENPPIFWVKEAFDLGATPADSTLLPPGAYAEQTSFYYNFFQTASDFDVQVEKYVSEGFLVRENTQPSDGTFEFPEGFELDRILLLKGDPIQTEDAGQGYHFSGLSFTGRAQRVAVIYRERSDPTTFGEADRLTVTATIDIIPDEEYQSLHENSRFKELVTLAREMKEVGAHPLETLTKLKSQLEAYGTDYGLSDFDSKDFPTHLQLGEGLVSEFELICNQFSWLLAVVMKEAGYSNIFLVRGYAGYGQEGYGGFADDAHQVILYEENGFLYLFDATLPDADQLEVLGEMTLEERAAYTPEVGLSLANDLFKVVTIGLVGGATTFAGWYLMKKRRRFKGRHKLSQLLVDQDELSAPLLLEPELEGVLELEAEPLIADQAATIEDEQQLLKAKAADVVFEAFYFIAEFYKKQGAELWKTPEELAQAIGLSILKKLYAPIITPGYFQLDDLTLELGAKIRRLLVIDAVLDTEEVSKFTKLSEEQFDDFEVKVQVDENRRTAEGLRIVESIFKGADSSQEPLMQEAIKMLVKIIKALFDPR